MNDFEKKMKGYVLTTAEILYHMPDHPSFLQTYIWQEYDEAPKYPTLKGFLGFWEDKLDGKLHSVRFASTRLIKPYELSYIDKQFRLH